MNLTEFKATLVAHSERHVEFSLPDGDSIPVQCHVTEVGLVTKKFVDCGGTFRETASCMLQIWEGNDAEHRLTAGKLARILEIAQSFVTDGSLPVEVEYEACSVSQYPVERVEITSDRVVFQLASKHTDCLAREACGLAVDEARSSSGRESDAAETASCCGTGKGC